jgi:hypothetical protein
MARGRGMGDMIFTHLALLMAIKWHFTVSLICISLITNDDADLFYAYWLYICVYINTYIIYKYILGR